VDSGRLLITMVHTHIILSMNPLAKINTTRAVQRTRKHAAPSTRGRRALPNAPELALATHRKKLQTISCPWRCAGRPSARRARLPFREKSKITLIVEKTSLSAGQGARHTVSGGLSSGVRGGGVHMSARGLRVPPSRSAHALDRFCRGAGAGSCGVRAAADVWLDAPLIPPRARPSRAICGGGTRPSEEARSRGRPHRRWVRSND
jgi:hypothetical protein